MCINTADVDAIVKKYFASSKTSLCAARCESQAAVLPAVLNKCHIRDLGGEILANYFCEMRVSLMLSCW